MSFDYFVHGLAVSSAVTLPEPIVDPGRGPDLMVTVGETRATEIAANDRVLSYTRGEKVLYDAARSGDRWLVRAPGVASFDVGSADIVMHADPALDEPGVLSLLLAGTGLAFFLMIRGELCLHASAVEVDGGCVAFAGSSGRGKTTLAALACAAGYPLFGDDLLRARINGDAGYAYRGSSEIRLRPSVAALADVIGGERRVTIDSRTSVRAVRSARNELPLLAIVLPRPDRNIAKPRAHRLQGADAFTGIAECPRLLGWTHAQTLNTELDHLVQLSRTIPVIETLVPWTTDLDPQVADDAIHESLAATLDYV
jgi:hypothetical protein